MSTLIANGTIVTADLTYKADVLIEDGQIIAIGHGLKGDTVLDATGCYVMPGGIDPHTHLEMPFMGTYSADDFDSGTRAALAGGTTMVVDFALPSPGQGLLDALQMWDNKSTRAHCDYSFHMAVTWWGEQVWDEMQAVTERGINTFKHFMAYKGALMVNDDELFASFRRCADLGAIPMVHAENGDVVAELSARLLAEGNTGPEAHAYSRPPQVEGEATNRAATDKMAIGYFGSTQDYAILSKVEKVADKLGVKPAQVAYAWVLSKSFVTAPIVGVTKLSQLDEAIAALDVKLDPASIRLLESAYKPRAAMGHS